LFRQFKRAQETLDTHLFEAFSEQSVHAALG
jgi:hypothetical protein